MSPEKAEERAQAERRQYQAAWEKYRVYSAWYWLPSITFVPGVFFFGWLLSFFLNAGLAHGLVAFGWMALRMIGGQGYAQFRCPRCGSKFFAGKGFQTVFTNKSLNCGLPTYARDSTDRNQEDVF